MRVLISAGPTREAVDPVRFLSNYSTGYMGAQLAAEALTRGHRVSVVSGPTCEPLPAGVRVTGVESSRDMERALRAQAHDADAIIMAAAVSDFRPARTVHAKLQRRARLTLKLEATPDIIARLPRRPRQVIAGFALETDRVVARARRKLRTKRLDVLVVQQINGSSSPFGRHAVNAWLLERTGWVTRLGRTSKGRIARALLDKIERLWYGQRKVGAL